MSLTQGTGVAQEVAATEVLLNLAVGTYSTSQAEQTQSGLPDAPKPTGQTGSQGQSDEQQQKRVMGIMPNFRSVTPGEVVPRATVREKFITSTEDNFDYSALFFAGLIAGDSMFTKATPEFHQGAAGFARYYWHTVADQSIENYFVEFIIPAINHEDSRYYAMGKHNGGVFKRIGYSLSRAVVTKSDTGKTMFNYGEVFGSAAAASISINYYPAGQRNVSTVMQDWGLDVTYDAVTFLFHEFWPDIQNAIAGKKKTVSAP